MGLVHIESRLASRSLDSSFENVDLTKRKNLKAILEYCSRIGIKNGVHELLDKYADLHDVVMTVVEAIDKSNLTQEERFFIDKYLDGNSIGQVCEDEDFKVRRGYYIIDRVADKIALYIRQGKKYS